MVESLPGISRDDINTGDKTIWRYRAALPVDMPSIVTLGEGGSPLLEKKIAGVNALFKPEWFSPTCSFKDKGASVMVSFLKNLGIPHILEDSSGNGGAAIAAYGAAADMKVRILAPAYAQPAKIAQMKIFNADVQLIPGTRDVCETEAIKQAKEIFYASHNWHPFFLQGTKMTAYEIWEDLGFKAPDNIIIPTGAGSNVLGCDIGFSELLAAGQIDRLPRLFGVQPENCNPISASFEAGTLETVEIDNKPTVAEGTSIKYPVRLREVLEGIHRSNGKMVSVKEDDIIKGLRELASTGLFAEPTSAITVAGLHQLVAAGEIKENETTVILLSGSGLKAAAFITELLSGE